MQDLYTSSEARLNITSQALEVIREFRFLVHIVTKSDLILRDLDTLVEINKVHASVCFTITTADDDIRSSNFSWLQYFDNGKPNQKFLDKLDAIRDVLTSCGRTLVQGALAWLWGRSERTIPIPGFKTVAQIEENVAVMEFGPLTAEQMIEIDVLLGR